MAASRTLRVTEQVFALILKIFAERALMEVEASSQSSVSADGETFSLFAANTKSNWKLREAYEGRGYVDWRVAGG